MATQCLNKALEGSSHLLIPDSVLFKRCCLSQGLKQSVMQLILLDLIVVFLFVFTLRDKEKRMGGRKEGRECEGERDE